MNENAAPLVIGIVAGEKSGDLLGAGLIKAIKQQHPNAQFMGIGGEAMLKQGFTSLAPLERLSVMGLIEPLKRLPELFAIRRRLFEAFIERGPAIVVGIDSPDFNLGLEKRLKQAGITTCHYVCPSVWAWRQGRVKGIRQSVDHVLTLLPFEKEFLTQHGIASTFVGHPLADQIPPLNLAAAVAEQPSSAALNQLCIMPGSRLSEVNALIDTFLQTAQCCLQQNPDLRFVIPAATNEIHQLIAQRLQVINDSQLSACVKLVNGDSHNCMRSSVAVLLASGTATLEAALIGKPMVVAYKMSSLGYAIASRLIKVKYVSLPNLLLKQQVVPELIQAQASPQKLASALLNFVDNPLAREDVCKALAKLHPMLAQNADQTAANAVLNLCLPTDKR